MKIFTEESFLPVFNFEVSDPENIQQQIFYSLSLTKLKRISIVTNKAFIASKAFIG